MDGITDSMDMSWSKPWETVKDTSDIRGARIALRELRVQSDGHPYRILYAFDPVRSALLLLGGDKTGNDAWYAENVPIAERLFAEHLKELEEERKQNERTS